MRSTRKSSGANGSLQQAAEDLRAGNIDNRRAAAGRRGKDGAAGVVKLADVKPQNGIAEPTIQPARLRDDRAGIGAAFEEDTRVGLAVRARQRDEGAAIVKTEALNKTIGEAIRSRQCSESATFTINEALARASPNETSN